MYCKICGDENDLTRVIRFWSPDDGWVAGRLCKYCTQDCAKHKPQKGDYAYDKRGDVFSDVDDAIDNIYG